MNFDLLKKCIDYCESIMSDKEDAISAFTSNMTLMTLDDAEYLATIKSLRVTCSLDGSQEAQDEFRIYANGEGSFKKTEEGLRISVRH